MKRTKKPATPKTSKTDDHKIQSLVLKSLDQDKAENVVSIDLAGKTAIADYMVIATGTSSRHLAGMAEKLRDRLSKEGVRARMEGADGGDWVVLDAGDVIVHLFRAEVRSFYNLEKLWAADFGAVDYTLYQSAP